MKNKYILFIVVFLLMTLTSGSFSAVQGVHRLSMYTGDDVSLITYISQQNIDFIFDDKTVVQNLNASVVSVNDSYVISAKDVGKSLLIISNSTGSFQLNIEVESSIESVELESNRISLLLGEIHKLNFIIRQREMVSDFSPSDIKWTTNKPHVASIMNGDTIRTKAVGETTFIGKSEDNNIELSFTLTVLGHGDKVVVTSEDRIRKLDVGQQVGLKAQLGTKDVTRNVEWESLTPHILKVDEYGIVTAVGQGSGQIQAKTSLDSNKSSYKLDAYSMIDHVTLNHTSLKFKAIGQTQQLMFNLYPKDKNNPPLLTGYRYVSSNDKVASVSGTGLITAEGPGITLISIIFDDSQKRASCTVEVLDNDELPIVNYIPLKAIKMQSYDGTAVIGEKVALGYSLSPENASDRRLTFKIPYGDDDQIKKIDGTYYFIPSKRGNIRIDVIGADDVTTSMAIPVTSPIDSLDLSLSTRRIVSTNEEALYVGETAELITKIYAKTGFKTSDVLDTSLKYEVKNKSIAELIIRNNRYYIEAKKRGKTEISVTNLEGLHESTLWLEVEDPIIDISSDDEVYLPMGISYSPRVSVNTISVPRGLSDNFSIKNMIDYRVNNIYLEESFIDNEIAYEEKMVLSYEGKVLNSTELNDRSNHEDRLLLLKQYKSNAKDGYGLLYNDHLLKDRNGRGYKFYTIEGSKIKSSYPVKLDISIMLKDTNYKTETQITWEKDQTVFYVKRLNNIYYADDLINQYGLYYSIGQLPLLEKIDLLLTYINNRESFDIVPSRDVLHIMQLIDEDELLKNSIKPLNEKVTKADLVDMSLAIHRKYVDKFFESDENVSMYYYDVIDSSLKEGLSLGYVEPISSTHFGSNQGVTPKMFSDMIKKMVPSYQSSMAYDNINEMTYADVVIMLGDLIK